MCRFHLASCLRPAQDGQQDGGRDIPYRHIPEVGKQVDLQQTLFPFSRASDDFLLPPDPPLRGHSSEGVGLPIHRDHLLRPALLAGVDTGSQPLPARPHLFPGASQLHRRVCAKADSVPPAGHGATVVPAPELRSIRVHQQEQTAAVAQLVRAGLRLGVLHLGRGKRGNALRHLWRYPSWRYGPFPIAPYPQPYRQNWVTPRDAQ